MVTLPGVTIRAKIYESTSLWCIGVSKSKRLTDYPQGTQARLSYSCWVRYRQEYEVTRLLNLRSSKFTTNTITSALVMMLEDFGGESLEKWMQDSPQMYCPILYLCFVSQLKSRSWAEFMLPMWFTKILIPAILSWNRHKSLTLALPLGLPAPIPASKSSCPEGTCLPVSRANRSDESFVGLPDWFLLLGVILRTAHWTPTVYHNGHAGTSPLSYCQTACLLMNWIQKFPKLFQIWFETDGENAEDRYQSA